MHPRGRLLVTAMRVRQVHSDQLDYLDIELEWGTFLTAAVYCKAFPRRQSHRLSL